MRSPFAAASIAALLVIAVSGCTIFGGPADRALRRTPAYRDGYQDGCAAATNAYSDTRKGPSTDNSPYHGDKVYSSGWSNGYQTCRSSLTPGVKANEPDRAPFPQPNPGHD